MTAAPLTVAAVAALKGCTPRTVRRAILAGALRATAVTPRLYLVSAADAARWNPQPRRGRPPKATATTRDS